MQAGWYLKSADAPVAHWWDGFRYTENTTPLSGYPFPVLADPLAATVPASAPQPTYASQQATPNPYGGQPAAAPAKTGMSRGLFWGLIGGGVLLLLIVIGVVIALVMSALVNPTPEPIAPPIGTQEPSTPDEPSDEPTEPTDDPSDDPTAGGDRGVDDITKNLFVELVRSSVPSLAGESDESVIAAGFQVCEMLDDGNDFDEVSNIMTQSGVAEEESYMFVALSVSALCEEHLDDM